MAKLTAAEIKATQEDEAIRLELEPLITPETQWRNMTDDLKHSIAKLVEQYELKGLILVAIGQNDRATVLPSDGLPMDVAFAIVDCAHSAWLAMLQPYKPS